MSDPARRIVDLVVAAPATLGPGWLVCVDGPSGSGKTTLAGAVESVARARGIGPVTMVHTDELLHGWRGLPGLGASVAALLAPLAEGRPGTWRRWDWHASEFAESHLVDPGGLLVLEGTGSWHPSYAPLVGVLAWVEVERSLRIARGIERDGEIMRAHGEQWQADEDALHERLGTREHAAVVVDGTAG